MNRVYLLDRYEGKIDGFNILEIVTIYKDIKISLYAIRDNDNYYIKRNEKITFLEEIENKITITKDEYNKMKKDFTSDNDSEVFIKRYKKQDGVTINIYDGKYEDLVTCQMDDETQLDAIDDKGALIDVSDLDIANDKTLLNLDRDEFESIIAQVRINYNIF